MYYGRYLWGKKQVLVDMDNKIKIPEKIRKKMRKDKPSLFALPLPSKSLDKKIEVASLRFIVNKNKATKICSHC